MTNDQWVQTSKPTKNDELADIFINQNFENEHDKGKKKKKGTSSSAKTGRRAPRQRSRNRSRVGSGSGLFDARGQELLSHWLNGSKVDLSFKDGAWGEYMSENEIIYNLLWQYALEAAMSMDGNKKLTAFQRVGNISMEIENGYNTGYEMLHGTKFFSFYYFASFNSKTSAYEFNFTVKWYDTINPNKTYSGDVYLSSALYKFYNPADYNISIIWNQQISITKDDLKNQ